LGCQLLRLLEEQLSSLLSIERGVDGYDQSGKADNSTTGSNAFAVANQLPTAMVLRSAQGLHRVLVQPETESCHFL
jgi:hypothetical protein